MKFPRNVRILRGHLDATPYAMVFFLLVLFMLLLGSLVYTPGVRLNLPVAEDLPGIDTPTVNVAMDANGRLYYENQGVEESYLTNKLHKAAMESASPLTIVILADQAVAYSNIIHLTLIAHEAGINDALLATLPRVIEASTSRQVSP